MAVQVVWKEEDIVGGLAVGPITVITAEADSTQLGRPYQPKCLCGEYAEKEKRSSEQNEWGYPLCPDCGDELPPRWVTLDDARAVAAEHGVALQES